MKVTHLLNYIMDDDAKLTNAHDMNGDSKWAT